MNIMSRDYDWPMRFALMVGAVIFTQRKAEASAFWPSASTSMQPMPVYIGKHQYTFPVAMQSGKLRRLFGSPQIIPELFVVTGDGRIAEIIHGQTSGASILGLARYARAHGDGGHALKTYRSY